MGAGRGLYRLHHTVSRAWSSRRKSQFPGREHAAAFMGRSVFGASTARTTPTRTIAGTSAKRWPCSELSMAAWKAMMPACTHLDHTVNQIKLRFVRPHGPKRLKPHVGGYRLLP